MFCFQRREGGREGEVDVWFLFLSFSCPQRVIRIPMATIEKSHNPNRIAVGREGGEGGREEKGDAMS